MVGLVHGQGGARRCGEGLAGQTFAAPSGSTLTMDKTNHHLHQPVMTVEIQADGPLNVLWQTETPIRAQPSSPSIAAHH
ncbi:hypothetical protein B1218_34030 [Pseudomonas ogarae]|nr:hypothetical protein B1218_34025 [Pseudomonas ogarae]OPG75091.1 hypothetical protein B1218_34030 [Pseudomonas ogarae]